MPKNSRFKESFEKRHGKCAQTLLKCQGELLYHLYWSRWRQFCYKKSLLLICKISRLFLNTLSADDKYSLFKRDNLTQPISVQLSRKQNTFFELFSTFLKSALDFEHFQKKMSVIAYIFPKLRSPKNLVNSMSKKSRFNGSFGKQHGKRAQTLLKFAWQHLYHIDWLLWTQLTCKKSLLAIWKIWIQFRNTLSAYGKYSHFKRGNLTQRI